MTELRTGAVGVGFLVLSLSRVIVFGLFVASCSEGDIAGSQPDASSSNDVTRSDGPTSTQGDADGRDSDLERDAPEVRDSDSDASSCVPGAPICGCEVCGNGRIDSCQGDGSMAAEACDGLELAGASCASLGFASGTLRCNGNCSFDVAECEDCLLSPHEVACRPIVAIRTGSGEQTNIHSIAMTSRSEELGIAWLTSGNLGLLNFARVRADLSIRFLRTTEMSNDLTELSLAATASGWILAASAPARDGVANDRQIRLTVFDSSGTTLSTRDAGVGYSATLTERVDGGPLLVARRSGAAGLESWAQLLNEDGTNLVPPTRLYDPVEALPSSGTFVGDGFLFGESGSDATIVLRIELDGRSSVAAKLPPQATGPGGRSFMSWNGQEARVIYLVTGSQESDSGSDPLPRVWWQRLGRDGVPIAAPVRMPDAGNEQASCNYGIAAFNDDTVVVRRRESQGSSWTELLRLDVGGALAIPPVRLNAGPPTYCHAGMARLGNEVFVAWPTIITGGRAQLTLARVAPY